MANHLCGVIWQTVHQWWGHDFLTPLHILEWVTILL